jgi:hypothetical protein
MLDNTLTLAVDVANDANTVNQVYDRYDEYQNRSVYIGPNHTVVAPNTLSFYRTQPKVAGNFPGMAKSAIKFSEAQAIDGVDGTTLSAPAIVEVSFAFPVGTSAAKMVELRQRAIALLDTDAVMDDLNGLLMI